MSSTLSAEDYIEGAIAGLKRGEKDFGVKSRHILAFKREEPGVCVGGGEGRGVSSLILWPLPQSCGRASMGTRL